MRTLDLRPLAAGHVDAFVASLRLGREACRSSYDIGREIGVPQRSIGFIANAARRDGHLVGSVHGQGYYLIQTRDELDATIGHIEVRVAGIKRTIEALEDAWAWSGRLA